MNNYLRLIMNENIKIFKRTTIWILIGLLVLTNLLVSLVMNYIFQDTLFTFWDFLLFSTYLVIGIQLICIIVAGDIVSSEFSLGTIKLLLIRPVSRVKILFSKYAAVVFVAFFVSIIHFISSTIFGFLFFHQTVLVEESQMIINTLLRYTFGFLETIIICTMAFMFSTVTRSSIFSIAFSIILLLVSGAVITLLSHYGVETGKYLLFANTDLTQHFIRSPIFESTTLLVSILNSTVHMLIFYVISTLFFIKRDILV